MLVMRCLRRSSKSPLGGGGTVQSTLISSGSDKNKQFTALVKQLINTCLYSFESCHRIYDVIAIKVSLRVIWGSRGWLVGLLFVTCDGDATQGIVGCVSYEVDGTYQLVRNKALEIHICDHFSNISELCLDLNTIVISSLWDDLSEVLKGSLNATAPGLTSS